MKIIFVSNYFNHHQQFLADRLNELCIEHGGSYLFVQTERMEEERVKMGWGEVFQNTPYLASYWENPEYYQQLIDDADVVMFGGTDEETYIQKRLKENKPVWRYSERLYRNGRYKCVSPRGLHKKFLDHTRYAGRRVYLLCAGAYVAGDFRLVLAYPYKKYKFGYFPAYRQYDWNALLEKKAFRKENCAMIFWAARMIDCKHPEEILYLAASLKRAGYRFMMNICGGGALEKSMHELAVKLQLDDVVHFMGSQNPDIVRSYMEQSDIYLATSDYGEGWGAVLNEAMNSGCAVVANRAMGGAPYLIKNGINGYLYRNGHREELFAYVKMLIEDQSQREKIGQAAYRTIANEWNPSVAAERLFVCMQAELTGNPIPQFESGPLSRA